MRPSYCGTRFVRMSDVSSEVTRVQTKVLRPRPSQFVTLRAGKKLKLYHHVSKVIWITIEFGDRHA